MGARTALICTLLVSGCSNAGGDPCAAITCAQGRICVAGRCVTPDSQPGWLDLGRLDGSTTQYDTGPQDSGAAKEGLDLTLPDAPPTPDTGQLPCPNTTTAAGSYSGTFVDGLGGVLGKGTVTFKLTSSGAQLMTLSGNVKGTALPGFGNYPIIGTIKGSVSCATVSTSLKGTLDGYAFNGKFNGILVGKTASGIWDGKQTGGPVLTVWGPWNATKQ